MPEQFKQPLLQAHPAEEFHQFSCHWEKKNKSGILFGIENPKKYVRVHSVYKWLHLGRDQAPEESELVLYRGERGIMGLLLSCMLVGLYIINWECGELV